MSKKKEAAKEWFDRAVETKKEVWDTLDDSDKIDRRIIYNLDEAIELKEDYAEAYLFRGETKDSLKQYEEAITDFNKAIELDPKQADIFFYIERGSTKSNLEQYEEAIEDFNKAMELDSTEKDVFSMKSQKAEAYLFRGKAKDGLKQYEEAIEDFNKAMELKEDYAEAYLSRGKAKDGLKQYERAIEDFNKAIESFYTDTEEASAYYKRGKAKNALKQYEEAIEDFNKAIELDPKLTDANNARSDANNAIYMILEKLKNEKLKLNLKKAFWCVIVFIILLSLLFK